MLRTHCHIGSKDVGNTHVALLKFSIFSNRPISWDLMDGRMSKTFWSTYRTIFNRIQNTVVSANISMVTFFSFF